MSVTTPDRVLKLYNPSLGTKTYLRMCRTPDSKRFVGAWWLNEEVNNRFPLDKGWEPPDTPSPPLYEIRRVSSKGRGLFATRDIKQNDVILRERPIVLAPKVVAEHRGYEISSMDKNLLQLLYWLEQEDREKVVQLHNCKSDCGPLDGIYLTNALHAPFPDSSIFDEYGVICLTMSYANHDCSANSETQFDHERVVLTLYATRDISAGEEITISYISPYASVEDRREELKEGYDFVCTCTPCSSPNTAESNLRRRFIESADENAKEFRKCIYESPSAKQAKRNIELLEQVLRMMDEEDLHSNRAIHERNLALLYGAFGDVGNFKKWCGEAAKTHAQMSIVTESGNRDENPWRLWVKTPSSFPVWALFKIVK